MGITESKEETKAVDSNGNVNNNIVIQDPVPVHNKDIIVVLYLICAIKIVELIIFLYKFHSNRLKKKYMKNAQNEQNC